jgi:hypothetical protein
VVGSSEHDNEPSSFMEGGEFLEQLSDSYPVNGSASLSF